MTAQLLTLSILTIPEREEYLRRLLESILALRVGPDVKVDIVYNRALDGAVGAAVARVRGFAPDLSIEVFFNAGDTTIAAGRSLQLSVCRTTLIAFVDDDLTLHGNIIPAIVDALATEPLGLLGFPSFEGNTDRRVKPRDATPSIDWRGLRFKPVQGMLCASHRALLADIGGFNLRRRYWGEWTELNLRLWRFGFPTAYQMHRGYLRHWQEAPNSPTRNMPGREQHVLWGLICTALEYDAADVNEATEVFWQLVEERYLVYSYGNELSPKNVLKTVLELVPQISHEWGNIETFRRSTAKHPFQFAPFQRFSIGDVKAVHAYALRAIKPYRAALERERQYANAHHTARDGAPDGATGGAPPSLLRAFRRLARSVRALRTRR
jgi:hypothetical protein